MYSTAINTDESREACAYILWSHAVAVDAAAVAGELEQAPDGPLVPLLLLHPVPHRANLSLRDSARNRAARTCKDGLGKAESEMLRRFK